MLRRKNFCFELEILWVLCQMSYKGGDFDRLLTGSVFSVNLLKTIFCVLLDGMLILLKILKGLLVPFQMRRLRASGYF